MPEQDKAKLEQLRQRKLVHLREALRAELSVATETKSDCMDVVRLAQEIDDASVVSMLQKEITGLKATNGMIAEQIRDTEQALTRQKEIESELKLLRKTLLEKNQGLQDGDANDRHEYLCELKEATLAFAREHFPVAGKPSFWDDFLSKPESILCPDKQVANVLVSLGVATKEGGGDKLAVL